MKTTRTTIATTRKRHRDEHDFVKTVVSGQERYETKERMTRFFNRMISMDYSDSGFPRWNDSVRQLMENAWVLSKWRAVPDPSTGRPMTLQHIAERLCRNLHVRLPANVSAVAHQSLRSGRMSVVDYYAMLWRENRTDVDAFVLWYEPPQFPKIRSYRGVFD